jgi:hypothetical protein
MEIGALAQRRWLGGHHLIGIAVYLIHKKKTQLRFNLGRKTKDRLS